MGIQRANTVLIPYEIGDVQACSALNGRQNGGVLCYVTQTEHKQPINHMRPDHLERWMQYL